ncbi:MAG: YlxR family protein [Clostridiales bacterium]|nr:YlxR family protein [Clostridiales bacterium]MCF8022179.1 YlxR family protein [Clostridiales bacterium]
MPKKKKKIPQRMCVGCQQVKPKKEMIRVVRTPEDNVEIDFKGKLSGRGAYLCLSSECFKQAYKAKRLEKNLNVTIPPEIYEELLAKIEEK